MIGAANNFHLWTRSGWRLTWPADNSSSLFKYSIQLGWPWCLASQHFINSSQLADLGLDQPTTSQSFPFRINWPWYLARPITFLSSNRLAFLIWLSWKLQHHLTTSLLNRLALGLAADSTFIFSNNQACLLGLAAGILFTSFDWLAVWARSATLHHFN